MLILPPSFNMLKQAQQQRPVTPEQDAQIEALLRSIGLVQDSQPESMLQGAGAPPTQAAPVQVPPEQTGYSNPAQYAVEIPEPQYVQADIEPEPGPSLAGPGGGMPSTGPKSTSQSIPDTSGGGSAPPAPSAIPPPPNNQKVVPPNQQKRQIPDPQPVQPVQPAQPTPFTPKKYEVKVGPKDKPGVVEWQDKKRGINMETEVVKQPDGTLKKYNKEVSKILTPAEKAQRYKELTGQILDIPGISEKPGTVKPAATTEAATGAASAPTEIPIEPNYDEAEKQFQETSQQVNKIIQKGTSGSQRIKPQKPAVPKSQSSLPPMFDMLTSQVAAIQNPKIHYNDQIAGLGDVNIVKNDETGREATVELPGGTQAPIRKVNGKYEVFVNNKWSVPAPDRPLGKRLLELDPLADEKLQPAEPTTYDTPEGGTMTRFSLGKDGRPFNLTRPGQVASANDKGGYQIFDDNGNVYIEDAATGLTTPVEDWSKDLPGQTQMSENYMKQYKSIGDRYRTIWTNDGKAVPGTYQDAVDNFTQSLTYKDLNNARTISGYANRKFGGDTEQGTLMDIVTNTTLEQLQKQQDDAIKNSKASIAGIPEALAAAAPDERAKILREITAAATDRAMAAGIMADLKPKEAKKLILEMTKKGFNSALKYAVGASSSTKTATSSSRDVSKSAAGELNHQTAAAMRDTAEGYARGKVADAREYASVDDVAFVGDQAGDLRSVLQKWHKAYPEYVLQGILTGDQIAALNPYKVLDEFNEIQGSQNSTPKLEAKINDFYKDLAAVTGGTPLKIKLRVAQQDKGASELERSVQKYNNSNELRDSVSATDTETESTRTSNGNGSPRESKYSLISGGNTPKDLGAVVAEMQQEGTGISTDQQKADIEQVYRQHNNEDPAKAKAMANENSTIIYNYLTGLTKSNPQEIRNLTERLVLNGITEMAAAVRGNKITLQDYKEYVRNVIGISDDEIKRTLGYETQNMPDGTVSVKNPGTLVDPGKIRDLITKSHGTWAAGGKFTQHPGYNGTDPKNWYKTGVIKRIAERLANGDIDDYIKVRAPIGMLKPLIDDVIQKNLVKGKTSHEKRLNAQAGAMRRARAAFND